MDGRSVSDPRVSPDGRTLVAFSVGAGVGSWRYELVDIAGARVRPLAPLPGLGQLSNAAWLPDGREVVYSKSLVLRYSGSSQIVRQDVRSGRTRVLAWTPFETSTVDVQGPGIVLADGRSTRQNLLEVSLSAGARGRRWLTRSTSVDRQPVFSPDGEWLAFTSNRSGNAEIWKVSIATGATRRLTEDAADDWDPAFTRDGRLLWSSGRGGHLEIWVADADGNSPRRVSDDGVDAENPVATPDGEIIYWSRNEAKRGFWKVGPDGTRATHVGAFKAGAVRPPEVSPDGRWIAWPEGFGTGETTVRVASLPEGNVLPFTIRIALPRAAEPLRAASGEILIGRVRWMPDGRALAFVARDERGVSGIFVQDFDPAKADTGATRRPLGGFDPDVETESFAISPDGTRLVVAGLETRLGVFAIEGLSGVGRARSR